MPKNMPIKNSTIFVIKFLRKINLKRFAFMFLIIVAVLGVGGSYYFYAKYQEIKGSPSIMAQKETEKLIAVIGKLIELPKGEIPTVATITDKEKLSNELFFLPGENGDKLLAYNNAKIAVLYRPTTNKIINVAPITIDKPVSSTQDIGNREIGHKHRIAYFNGTNTLGLAYLAEKAVQEKYSDYETIRIANAARKDYTGILVIDLVGDHSKEVIQLAGLLGGTVADLPSGEIAPDADILVISGK